MRRAPGTGSIADVRGIRVGHWTDLGAATGCTVVLCEGGAVAGVDVRGAAPGTRETDLLRPGSLVEHVHAVLLSGGSAFGLAAADGVMRYLEERRVGFPTSAGPVPIVPAAALYDLALGRSDVRPGPAEGYAACLAAGQHVQEGSVGAGTGAVVGKMAGAAPGVKGGIGTASRRVVGGVVVGALIAVNAVGSVYDYASGALVAGAADASPDAAAAPRLAGTSTTIGVVATDAPLDRGGASRLATIAHDGLALAIRPAHTRFDGDTLFALSLAASDNPRVDPLALHVAAVEVVAEAVLRAVRAATSLHGTRAVADA